MSKYGFDEVSVKRVVLKVLGDRNLKGRIPEQAVTATIGAALREFQHGGVELLTDVIVGHTVMLENIYIKNKPLAWVA